MTTRTELHYRLGLIVRLLDGEGSIRLNSYQPGDGIRRYQAQEGVGLSGWGPFGRREKRYRAAEMSAFIDGAEAVLNYISRHPEAFEALRKHLAIENRPRYQ